MAAVPALMWVATAVTAAGAVYSAQTASAEGKYNRKVAERNAVVTQQQALVSEAAARRDARRTMGKMTAAYGASGVVGSEGSPLEVLEDSATEAELDALTIRYNGSIGAMGYQEEGALARARGRAGATAGYIGAGSAILSGATKVAAYNDKPPAPKRK